ncbi:hypothetical protein D3C73_1456370 [compost metagenome]
MVMATFPDRNRSLLIEDQSLPSIGLLVLSGITLSFDSLLIVSQTLVHCGVLTVIVSALSSNVFS